MSGSLNNGKRESSCHHDNYMWFGSKRNSGSNNVYPGDLIPFTLKPLFLIIDSDNSHAFKAVTMVSMCFTKSRQKSYWDARITKPPFVQTYASNTEHSRDKKHGKDCII